MKRKKGIRAVIIDEKRSILVPKKNNHLFIIDSEADGSTQLKKEKNYLKTNAALNNVLEYKAKRTSKTYTREYHKYYQRLILLLEFVTALLVSLVINKVTDIALAGCIYEFVVLFEAILLARKKIALYNSEETIARKRSAIYRTINAYNKYKRIPTVEEVEKTFPNTYGFTAHLSRWELLALFIVVADIFMIGIRIAFVGSTSVVIWFMLAILLNSGSSGLFELYKLEKPLKCDVEDAIKLITFFDQEISK